MSWAYNIYISEAVPQLQSFLEALARASATSHVYSMMKIAVLLGFLKTLLENLDVFEPKKIMRWIITFLAVLLVGWKQTATVHIYHNEFGRSHMTSPSQTKVEGVPLGVALIGAVSSQIAKGMGDLLYQSLPKTAFSYNGTLNNPLLSLYRAREFSLQDSEIRNNMRGFCKQCLIPALQGKKYSAAQLMDRSDVFETLSVTGSPLRMVKINNQILSCKEAAPVLRNMIQNATVFMGPSKDTDKVQDSFLWDGLSRELSANSVAPQTFSGKYSEYLRALITKNTLLQGLDEASSGGDSGLLYATGKANAYQINAFLGGGIISAQWLPIVKSLLEIVSYSLFPLIVILAMLPGGARVLAHYAKTLVWIHSWHPMFIVINCLFSHILSSSFNQMGTITVSTVESTLPNYTMLLAVSGYMMTLVPMLALSVFKGLEQGSSLVQGLMGTLSHSIHHPAEEITSGNVSLGVSNTNSHASGNISRHHVDLGSSFRQSDFYETNKGTYIQETALGQTKINALFANPLHQQESSQASAGMSASVGVGGASLVGANMQAQGSITPIHQSVSLSKDGERNLEAHKRAEEISAKSGKDLGEALNQANEEIAQKQRSQVIESALKESGQMISKGQDFAQKLIKTLWTQSINPAGNGLTKKTKKEKAELEES